MRIKRVLCIFITQEINMQVTSTRWAIKTCHNFDMSTDFPIQPCTVEGAEINPLECKGNYSVTTNNVKFVHWPLMGGLLHLVHREGDWAGTQPAQAPSLLYQT